MLPVLIPQILALETQDGRPPLAQGSSPSAWDTLTTPHLAHSESPMGKSNRHLKVNMPPRNPRTPPTPDSVLQLPRLTMKGTFPQLLKLDVESHLTFSSAAFSQHVPSALAPQS